jgi:hypothetical protein
MSTVVSYDDIKMFAQDFHLLGDLFDFVCGKWIGGGMGRRVYEYRFDASCVVKIDTSGYFNNVVEYDFWQNMSYHHPEIAKFMAPCVSLSSCGRILVQKKTTPIDPKKKLPVKIPQVLACDLKIENWGIFKNRVVCHDYANHRLFSTSSTKMVAPNWWLETRVKGWSEKIS